jgi:hypothetical protein
MPCLIDGADSDDPLLLLLLLLLMMKPSWLYTF